MPFGLTNAPAALINDVLRDFLTRFVFVYLDDILVFSCSLEEHESHVSQVLQRLLFGNADKCKFHSPSVSFLGYIIEAGRVRADPCQILAVPERPKPTT